MALSAARNTLQMGDRPHADLLYLPMKTATTVYQGSLVCIDAGYAAPARAAVGLIVIGRAEHTQLNPGANAATYVTVRRGTFKWVNYASDTINAANLGQDGYAFDDQTVALTNGSNARSRVGKIVQIDTDGVWVETGVTDIKGPTVANAAGAPTQAEFNALTNALRSLGIIS